MPEAQTVLLADNLHGQTTEQFREYLYKECNTLLWLYASQCTDELQPVDAGYGRRIQVGVGVKLDLWLEHGENLQKWENGSLTASERRVLLTHWVGAVVEEIDADQAYRKRLFEKTGSGMTADGSEDDRINLEGLSGPYNFMDVEVDGSSDDEEEGGDSSPGETGRGGGDLDPQQLGDDDPSSCDESDGESGGILFAWRSIPGKKLTEWFSCCTRHSCVCGVTDVPSWCEGTNMYLLLFCQERTAERARTRRPSLTMMTSWALARNP